MLAVVAAGVLARHPQFLKTTPWRIPTLTRQGLANLYRQGNQAQAILVALGLGVMFTLTVYLVQHSLVSGDHRNARRPAWPNVFLIGITPEQAEPLKAVDREPEGRGGDAGIRSQRRGAASTASMARRFEELHLTGMSQRFRGSRSVMWADEKPSSLKVIQGAWWKHGETQPVVSVDEEPARTLGVKAGRHDRDFRRGHGHSRLASRRCISVEQMRVGRGQRIRIQSARARIAAGYVLWRRAHEAGVTWVRSSARRIGQFPTVTVINVAEALAIVQQVVDQIALVIRFLSGFAILAGRDYPRRERRRHALPPRARSGDSQNAGRDAPHAPGEFSRWNF